MGAPPKISAPRKPQCVSGGPTPPHLRVSKKGKTLDGGHPRNPRPLVGAAARPLAGEALPTGRAAPLPGCRRYAPASPCVTCYYNKFFYSM